MTTITVTAADIGITIARNGVISALRFLVADRNMYQLFTLIDDAPPYVLPKQLFNCDMLTFATSRNVFKDTSISFGNLTVAACPASSKFEVDCTGTVLAADIAAQRRALIERAKMPPPPKPTPPTYTPPKNYKEKPPPPPDPDLVAANEEAQRIWALGRDNMIRGRSLEEIRTELLIIAQRKKQGLI
jgi:hypothetical protein